MSVMKKPKTLLPRYHDQGPVVGKVDNVIHWINLYPVNNAVSFTNSTYPLDNDIFRWKALSSVWATGAKKV